MHETRRMRGRQAVRDVERDAPGFVRLQARTLEPIAQGLALEELHHEEGTTVVNADVEQAHDVGLVERSGDSRLLQESLDEVLDRGGPPARGA